MLLASGLFNKQKEKRSINEDNCNEPNLKKRKFINSLNEICGKVFFKSKMVKTYRKSFNLLKLSFASYQF